MSQTTLEWDYTHLSQTYASRPDYSPRGILAMLAIAGVGPGDLACDIGAGSAHLTLHLLRQGLRVDAVEPNAAMTEVGVGRTSGKEGIAWYRAVAEDTKRPSGAYDLVTYGSSFSVVDTTLAMNETVRMLKPGGWFSCMWNHRDLNDPLQKEVEQIVRSWVPGYDYGTRRADQSPILRDSGLFHEPFVISAPVIHEVGVEDWMAAWRSHATLARQAGDKREAIISAIEALLRRNELRRFPVPYVTRIWVAQRR
jgi:SAM-dependent methyltransferase